MEIVERAPDSRFGTLALTEIARIRSLGIVDEPVQVYPEEAEEPVVVPVREKRVESIMAAAKREVGDDPDGVVPVEDPFFALRMGRKLAPPPSSAKEKSRAVAKPRKESFLREGIGKEEVFREEGPRGQGVRQEEDNCQEEVLSQEEADCGIGKR